MTNAPAPTVEPLLHALRAEEDLLRAAVRAAAVLYAALRSGAPDSLAAARGDQDALAAALLAAAASRSEAAVRLAAEVDLPPDGVTLAALAARLPAACVGEVEAARVRLRSVTDELQATQRRNAILADHVRRYLRGVVASLTAADAPARYGPTGGLVSPGGGAAVRARG